MDTLNERHAVNDDKEIEFSFPEIEESKCQLLILYQASSELHKNGLKDEIVKFLLLKKKIKSGDIEAFTNAAIYFKLPGDLSRAEMITLNDEFDLYISTFEKAHRGKVFWVLNKVSKFKTISKQRVAMLGRGNKTYFDEFKEQLKELVDKIKIKSVIKTQLRYLKRP